MMKYEDLVKLAEEILEDQKLMSTLETFVKLAEEHGESKDVALSIAIGYLSGKFDNGDMMISCIETIKLKGLLKQLRQLQPLSDVLEKGNHYIP
jgi:hypothetical protein